ncbi:unnamed protein product [Dicrocoelium dendriticum]|nr:unnamed protein product [Dicrocoelium dendriticum]
MSLLPPPKIQTEKISKTVDIVGYEKEKEVAQARSQAGSNALSGGIDLDAHAIADLREKNIPATDDSYKYNYAADGAGNYDFPDLQASIVAIRQESEFCSPADQFGQTYGFILDKTIFYAEAGGQQCDHGFITGVDDDVCEFSVFDVQCRGGYILHIGRLEGRFAVGDKVRLSIDPVRRLGLMRNHTGTHVLNFAVRVVLGDTDQKGSLVAPEKLRFDFSAKRGMCPEELLRMEAICDSLLESKVPVYATDVELSTARTINGLRAVFGEVYPDPVRVVSIGIPVESLVNNPSGPGALHTSVEFCGGTHLLNVKHIGVLVIVSEEAIAKGVRRIVALTGSEGERAKREACDLQAEVQELLSRIQNFTACSGYVNGDTSIDVDEFTSKFQNLNQSLGVLSAKVSQACISQVCRVRLRDVLSEARKQLDDRDKLAKSTLATEVMADARRLIESLTSDGNAKTQFIVHVFPGGASAKAIHAALKLLERECPGTAVMALSPCSSTGKFVCLTQVPKNVVSCGLKANEWVGSISTAMNGKGGGKDLFAQATGTRLDALDEVIKLANQFAREKLRGYPLEPVC